MGMIILYVADQLRSRDFYEKAFGISPTLDVPGMTELVIGDMTLGLMPEKGIAKILGDTIAHPETGSGIPRCELYLYVDDPREQYEKALAAGAKGLSPPAARDWGDEAAYCADPDGHILAFARKI
jgi:lactoylglutathione lyase